MQACTSPRGIAKAREMQGTYAQSRPTSHWVNYMEGFIDATAGDREMALLAIKKTDEKKIRPIAYNYAA